jgi:hypothetical protein
MVANPAFDAWLITNIVPVAALGLANGGGLLMAKHPLNWQIRNSNGTIRHRGFKESGGTSTGSTPTRAQQRSTHTERKFIEEEGSLVKEGDILTFQGRQKMCKPGHPNAPQGDNTGCQVHMQWFCKVKKAILYYADELGKVTKIRPNGEATLPDGTIVPAPTRPPTP